jgi:hypothetical protein
MLNVVGAVAVLPEDGAGTRSFCLRHAGSLCRCRTAQTTADLLLGSSSQMRSLLGVSESAAR